MTGVPVDGLPEGWEALSREDADALAAPLGAKERVRLKLALTLGASAGLGAAAGLAASGTTAASAGSTAATAGAATAAGSAPAQGLLATATKAVLLKKVVLLGVAAATAVTGGTAAYVEVKEQRHEAAERQAVAHRARLFTPPAPPSLQVAPAQVASAPAETVAAPPLPVDTLGSERAVLDAARLAISQGRLGDARLLLDKHAAAYRDGSLVEEREALSIRLLVREGRSREAQQRAATFRRQHPRSIQLPVIDEAVRSKR
jgi:hypothetical protein